MSALVGVVLAGGKSRRMGRDKAEIAVAGRPMLEWVAEALVGALGRAYVVGRPRPAWWRLEGVAFLRDNEADRGPLGGLATALELGDVLLVGCDMPAVSTEAVRWLVEEARAHSDATGIVAERGGRIEPLFAVYRHILKVDVARRLGARRLALKGLVEGFVRVDASQYADQLRNVNEPADLKQVEELLGRR